MALGRTVPEDDVLLPLSADASQLYAIRAAGNGESFVLHGPPGTGKSQTITALIANSLAQGQSVLFVAEKMAALEVVQKRLSDIGIGPFCLELHSNKSKKRDVLERLRQAMDVVRGRTCQQHRQKAEQIAALRKELEQYAHALHIPQPCGATVFELVDQYEKNFDAPDLRPFLEELLENARSEELDRQLAAVEQLIAAAKAAGHPHEHPLQCVQCTQYSQKLRMELPQDIAAYQCALKELKAAAETCAGALEQLFPETLPRLQYLSEMVQRLVPWTQMPASWAKEEGISQYLTQVEEMAGHFLRARDLHRQLSRT